MIGTSRSVYAQIIDKKSGLVVGNLVTSIPVTLNGQEQTIAIPMEAIAYTTGTGVDASDLELQIVGSATPYLNLTQFGFINVKSLNVTLPTALNATPFVPTSVPAPVAGLVAV